MSTRGPAGTRIDLAPLLGAWVNSNPGTEWIRSLVLAPRGEALTLRVTSVQQPYDWGELEVTPYVEPNGEVGFHGVCERPGRSAILAANMNKGLIIIVAFYRFDDGRTNLLSREFYYRQA